MLRKDIRLIESGESRSAASGVKSDRPCNGVDGYGRKRLQKENEAQIGRHFRQELRDRPKKVDSLTNEKIL